MLPKIKLANAPEPTPIMCTLLMAPPPLPQIAMEKIEGLGSTKEICSRGSRTAYQVTVVTVVVAVMRVTATMKIVATGRQVYRIYIIDAKKNCH
jgi:hypothetical protein